MLKITDGVNEKTVTRGMFDSLYSRMGYKVVVENKVEKAPVVKKVEEPIEEKVEEPKVEEEPKRFDAKKGKKYNDIH